MNDAENTHDEFSLKSALVTLLIAVLIVGAGTVLYALTGSML